MKHDYQIKRKSSNSQKEKVQKLKKKLKAPTLASFIIIL